MKRRQGMALAATGLVGVAVIGSGLYFALKPGRATRTVAVAANTPTSAMGKLAEGLRRGDGDSLKSLCQLILKDANQPKSPISDAEARDSVEVLMGLRAGFLKFPVVARASSVTAASQILARYGVEPAPSTWVDALNPIHDLMLAALVDVNPEVRATGLQELANYWNWLPGRSMTPLEETSVEAWKGTMYEPARRCLSDKEPKVRASAVVCIGSVPISELAAAAVPNVDYPDDGMVRYKALMTFANRPNLLTTDMVLRRLHDTTPSVPELAEIILRSRGLNREQIFLGKQITNPHADVRVSVIPLIKDRTDIDPEVWLIQLSHDSDPAVRIKAAEALLERDSVEAGRRLVEMAKTDGSNDVRALAGKYLTRTAALPPLPGSPSLTPKAN